METTKEPAFIETLLSLVIVLFIIGVGVIMLYQHFQKNLFVQKLKQETLKNIHQNDLLSATIQAQEEERKRIAQDLHDELGAVLSIMRMNMVMIEQQHKADFGNMIKKIENVRSLTETALASVRNISHQLMPPQLEIFGLIKTLDSVLEKINVMGGLYISLIATEPWPKIQWPISLGLYRIIMELINNTIKHSGADRANIELSINTESVKLIYTDNGKGYDVNVSTNGLGYIGIESRLNIFKGKLHFEGDKSKGFYAKIEIPLG